MTVVPTDPALSHSQRGSVALLLLWTLITTIILVMVPPLLSAVIYFASPGLQSSVQFSQIIQLGSWLSLAVRIVGGLLTGLLADRIGRKRMLVAGAFLMAAGIAALNGSIPIPIVLVVYCLFQLGVTGTLVATLALLFERAAPDRRMGALAGRGFFINLQSMLTVLLYSMVISFVFVDSNTQVDVLALMHAILWGAAGIGVLGAVALLIVIRDARPATDVISTGAATTRIYGDGGAQRFIALLASLLLFLGAAAVITDDSLFRIAQQFQRTLDIPAIIVTARGVNYSTFFASAYGITYTAFTLGAPLVFLVPFVARRAGIWRSIAIFVGLAIAGIALFLFGPHLRFAFAGLALATGGIVSTEALLTIAVLQNSDIRRYGLISGSLIALTALGAFGATAVTLYDAHLSTVTGMSSATLYVLAAGVMAAAAFIAIWGLHQQPSQPKSVSPASSSMDDLIIEIRDI
jgi:MFS family permease